MINGNWRSSVRIFAGVAALNLLAGCSEPEAAPNPDVAPVHGTITLNGKPFPRAFIMFESFESRPSTGMTDANGRYEMHFDHKTKGARIGGHTVRIRKHYNPMIEPSPKPLPQQYDSESTIVRRVTPGDNVFNFDLIEDTPADEPRTVVPERESAAIAEVPESSTPPVESK
jgi:hypothetical protein